MILQAHHLDYWNFFSFISNNVIFMMILYCFFLKKNLFNNDCVCYTKNTVFHRNNKNHEYSCTDIFKFRYLGKLLLFIIIIYQNSNSALEISETALMKRHTGLRNKKK